MTSIGVVERGVEGIDLTEEMADYSPEKKSGCVSMLFRRTFWPRKPPASGAIPIANGNAALTSSNSKRRRGGSDETAFLDDTKLDEPQPVVVEKPIMKAPLNQPKPPPYNYQDQVRKPVNEMSRPTPPPNQGMGQGRRPPKEQMSLSSELDSMINDHQRSKGSNNLVRASSGNVMLYGHLGNLRQPGGGNLNPSNLPNATTNVLDHLPKTARELASTPAGKYGNNNNINTTTNVVTATRKTNEISQSNEQAGSLCRALSTRMDPEQLKVMGNEDYKDGRFAEALALYDAAIALDPNKASYRSNKSAALTALGRLLEAVFECREAIKIEPYYHRAHHRLATLYLRLGEAEKALYHYKQSGPEADTTDISQARGLQSLLNKCTEAKRLRDWNGLIKETDCAISSGADSAPLIYSLRAEALLRLHRHQDADATLSKGPNFDIDESTKFFGAISNANLLVIRAQVHMAAGRFEDAVASAQQAARLDSNSKEVLAIVKRTKGVATARSTGNDFFKSSKFSEACMAYGEGLEHDPLNSVLLCNRAACRSKLGQFEKAIEDCTKALNVRPSYTKARLRRADCNAKLERWEAAVQDYEILKKETPDDEEVRRASSEAEVQLNKQRRQDPRDMKPVSNSVKAASNVVVISDNEHFNDIVSFPGMCVAYFCNKSGDTETMNLMEQLCKRHPRVKFLKLEVDDHPQLAKSQGATSVPVFKIYKNGQRVKEIPGNNHEFLESSVKFYATD